MEKCPHCGTSLPVVKDAFCSLCHGPLDPEPILEEMSQPAGPGRGLLGFTLPARIVLSVCMLLGGAGTLAYIAWITEGLPSGSYPLWFFVLPAFIVAGGLAVVVLAVLRACGVRIYRDQ